VDTVGGSSENGRLNRQEGGQKERHREKEINPSERGRRIKGGNTSWEKKS